MAEKPPMIKKKLFDGSEVEIVGELYEPGKPEEPGHWRNRFEGREDMIKYLNTAERYWSKEGGFGSERRKNPA